MRKHYIKLRSDPQVLVARESIEGLRDVEAITFDCDGVLIDIRGSYDKVIKETIRIIFNKLFHVEFLGEPIGAEEITALRRSGGFNNDLNTTYILALWLFLNLPRERIEVLGGLAERLEPLGNVKPNEVVARISRLMIAHDLSISKIARVGKYSIKEMLGESSMSGGTYLSADKAEAIISKAAEGMGVLREYTLFKRLLGYSSKYGEGILQTMFNDLYYGATLVKEVFGEGPYFATGEGLFRNERVNIEHSTLKKLVEILGEDKLGLATGRDSKTTRLVLGELLDFFVPEACIYILDELRAGADKNIEKPSPYSLIKSSVSLGYPNSLLYVGNSMEDLIMADQAKHYGIKTYFMAVTGLSHLPESDRELFMSKGADIIAETPDSLPSILKEVWEVW